MLNLHFCRNGVDPFVNGPGQGNLLKGNDNKTVQFIYTRNQVLRGLGSRIRDMEAECRLKVITDLIS